MFETKELGSPIESEDQAKNWVVELVNETESLRAVCDSSLTIGDQRKDFLRWLLKRGESLGVLQALKRTNYLSDSAYNELRGRILATQVPSVRPGVIVV